jgi:uncharacterized phage-associated protein
MARIDDVAAEVLRQQGPMTAMKLQKLVYYCQAWHLVWEERPLFDAKIEAWANGPVSPYLYRQHRGEFRVTRWPMGDPKRLRPDERETIQVVLATYGDLSGQRLSELTHREPPWRDARRGLEPGERGHREITHAAMAEFYSALFDSYDD